MKYLKAKDVLPESLIVELQKYVSGSAIYIPKPKDTRLGWGEVTGMRDYLNKRNNIIKDKHNSGYAIKALAKEFYLSYESVKKIVYE